MLEGINLIEKKSKNNIQWKGNSGGGDSQLEEKISRAQKEVLELQVIARLYRPVLKSGPHEDPPTLFQGAAKTGAQLPFPQCRHRPFDHPFPVVRSLASESGVVALCMS